MKKTLFAIIAVAAVFASCRKTRTCECTYTQTSTIVSPTTTLSSQITGAENQSVDKYKKSKFIALTNCFDRTVTQIYPSTPSNNATQTVITDYQCKIK